MCDRSPPGRFASRWPEIRHLAQHREHQDAVGRHPLGNLSFTFTSGRIGKEGVAEDRLDFLPKQDGENLPAAATGDFDKALAACQQAAQ